MVAAAHQAVALRRPCLPVQLETIPAALRGIWEPRIWIAPAEAGIPLPEWSRNSQGNPAAVRLAFP